MIAVTASAACIASLAALVMEERSRNLWGVVIVGGLVVGSFATEAAYRKFTRREIPSHLASLSRAVDDPSSPGTAGAEGE